MAVLGWAREWPSRSSTPPRRSRRCAPRCTPSSPRCSTPAATSSARRSPPSSSELADYLGTPSVVGVANGTDALVLALRALGVGPDDDVVVPSFTFYASAEAIAVIGANPVFCDVDPRDVLRHARHRPRGADSAHEGRHGGAPVRQHRAGRGDRGARRPGARGRRAGCRLAHGRRAPRGCAGRSGDALVLPVQEPRRVRRRRAPSRPPIETAGRDASGCCASTARATRCRSSSSATTRAWTSCRPRCCGSSCRSSTRWCDGRRAAAAHYAEAGASASSRACPSRSTGAIPRGTCT